MAGKRGDCSTTQRTTFLFTSFPFLLMFLEKLKGKGEGRNRENDPITQRIAVSSASIPFLFFWKEQQGQGKWSGRGCPFTLWRTIPFPIPALLPSPSSHSSGSSCMFACFSQRKWICRGNGLHSLPPPFPSVLFFEKKTGVGKAEWERVPIHPLPDHPLSHPTTLFPSLHVHMFFTEKMDLQGKGGGHHRPPHHIPHNLPFLPVDVFEKLELAREKRQGTGKDREGRPASQRIVPPSTSSPSLSNFLERAPDKLK